MAKFFLPSPLALGGREKAVTKGRDQGSALCPSAGIDGGYRLRLAIVVLM